MENAPKMQPVKNYAPLVHSIVADVIRLSAFSVKSYLPLQRSTFLKSTLKKAIPIAKLEFYDQTFKNLIINALTKKEIVWETF